MLAFKFANSPNWVRLLAGAFTVDGAASRTGSIETFEELELSNGVGDELCEPIECTCFSRWICCDENRCSRKSFKREINECLTVNDTCRVGRD